MRLAQCSVPTAPTARGEGHITHDPAQRLQWGPREGLPSLTERTRGKSERYRRSFPL